MGGSSDVMARFLVIAFFAVVGIGVYTFMINTDLEAARDQLATTTKDRDTWKTRLTQYGSESQADAANLQQCQAKVTDLQSQIDAVHGALARRPDLSNEVRSLLEQMVGRRRADAAEGRRPATRAGSDRTGQDGGQNGQNGDGCELDFHSAPFCVSSIEPGQSGAPA